VNRRFARRLSRLVAAGALVLASLVLLTGLGPGREAALAATPHTATVTHFVFTADSADTSGDTTYINNPLTNGNPDNITFVTPNYNPGGKGGTYDPVQTGVWWPSGGGEEGVFNQNGSTPPVHSSYNLLIFPS
jgi:hypothetical protein